MTTPTPEAPPEPLAVRPAEAAKLLGISPRLLWSLTADKSTRIPHFKLGRAKLYPIGPLRDWLADQAAGGKR